MILSRRADLHSVPSPVRRAAFARKIVYLLLSSLFLSLTFNVYFALKQFVTRVDQGASNIPLAAGWLPVLLAFILAVNFPGRLSPLPRAWRGLFVFVLFVSFYSSCFGLLNTLEPRHFIGDFFRFSIPWIGLYLGLRSLTTLRDVEGPGSLRLVFNALVLLSLADALKAITLGWFSEGFHVSSFLFFFAFVWAFLREKGSKLNSFLVVAACASAAVLSWKRANLIIMVYVVFASQAYLALAANKTRSFTVLIWFLVLGSMGLYAISHTSVLSEIFSGVPSRIENVIRIATGQVEDDSFESRHLEKKNVLDHFGENPEWLLTGLGFGCEIPSPWLRDANTTPRGNMHHVHISTFVVLLRNGVLGLLLMGLFVMKILGLRKGIFGPFGRWRALCLIYAGADLMTAYVSNFMMNNITLGFIVALGYCCLPKDPP